MSVLDGWRLCPRCGTEVERREDHVACPACGFVHWASAVPAVQGLVVRDGLVLLSRRAIEPARGKWDVPGGFMGEREHPLDALRRELREETGLEIEPDELLLATLDQYTGRTVLCLTWLAHVTGGEERMQAAELLELRWFARDELPPPDEHAFPEATTGVLAAWQQHA